MIGVFPLAASKVSAAGVAVIAAAGTVSGGIITNPARADDQGLAVAEILFIDIAGPASLGETATTTPLQPGQSFVFPAGLATNVSVNAASAGHKFSGFILQPNQVTPPAPQEGTFPPSGPTTVTNLGGMASYLYQEYNDDDALQAFVASYNQLADIYVRWFAETGLPVYTNTAIAGPLLDWVAEGLYGMVRPTLGSGRNRDIGPLNTYTPNFFLPINAIKRVGPSNVQAVSDDVFKRIMTWNFYKGDGNVFNARWLKRRLMRFLIGVNGTAPNIDQTYAISVTFGPGIIAIAINVGTRAVIGGALPNRFAPNTMTPNQIRSVFMPGPTHFPLEPVLKEAIDSGVLQFPFQYTVSIDI